MAQTIWPPSKQEKTVKANTSPDTSLAATSDPFGEGKCKRTSQSVKNKKIHLWCLPTAIDPLAGSGPGNGKPGFWSPLASDLW